MIGRRIVTNRINPRLVAVLLACAAPSGCADPDALFSPVRVYPMGTGQYMVTCVDSVGFCTGQSAKLCPAGYHVSSSATNPMDFGRMTMVIQCAAASPPPPSIPRAEAPARSGAPSEYDNYLNAVVVIKTGKALGTGFFVSPAGLIVTNKHVVESNKIVEVWYRSGEHSDGSVIAVDAVKDLAIVKVQVKPPAVLELSRGGDARIGGEVIAIGAPEGFSWSISKGIVSAFRDKKELRYIQTDTAINHGNSGGPLIDLKSGHVIGINSLGIDKREAEGLNFAVSSEDALFSFGNLISGTVATQ
jgi:S1-C subfamily serine protease